MPTPKKHPPIIEQPKQPQPQMEMIVILLREISNSLYAINESIQYVGRAVEAVEITKED